MCYMAGMPGTSGTHGPIPDTRPVLQWRVCACVFLVQSGVVRRSRGLDLAVQTLSPGDKDPPVLVCFVRTLVSHTVLVLPQSALTYSPCTCPHQDISPQFPFPPTSPHLTSPPHFLKQAQTLSVLLEPAGNPPAQPVLGAPSQSTVISIIQQLILHKSVLPDQLCPY